MNWISVEQASTLCRERTAPLPPIRLPLSQTLGCLLDSAVTAQQNQPRFDRSPLDGYALQSADIAGANTAHPATLQVIGSVYAGADAGGLTVAPGTAVRIMTGGMVPRGADCILRQEDTRRAGDLVQIFASVGAGENICFAGEEYRSGDVLLPKGLRLDPAALAVAAGAGVPALTVIPRPKAAVVTTGDELRPAGTVLVPGQIWDSNAPYLTARLQQLHTDTVTARHAGDDPAVISEALLAAAEAADVVFTTGGVSVGERDLLPEVLSHLGAEIIFHGVHMKPGMPTLFALLRGRPVLALSGNPFAAAVALEVLGRPILAALSGNDSLLPAEKTAVLESDYHKTSPVRRYLRGTVENGRLTLPGLQANGQMRSMIGCNALAVIPGGSPALQEGQEVEVLLL